MKEDWKIYNHALIPNTPPHEVPNTDELKNGKILKKVLFARYTTDFDCGYETEWWYLIKDDEVDLSKLPSKKRYEITKGLKYCEVRKISINDYLEELYKVYYEAFSSYKKVGKPQCKKSFFEEYRLNDINKNIELYGVFLKENNELVGYSLNKVYDDFVELSTAKFMPKYLSKNISAALVYSMMVEYLNLQNKKYVNDGERSIRHDTNFQDYLIKYFGFRKAYCKLNIEYNSIVKLAVSILYPFRDIIRKFNKSAIINNINSVIIMESIRRSFVI